MSIYQDRELSLLSTLTGFDVIPGTKVTFGSVIALENLETSHFLEVVVDTLGTLASSSASSAKPRGGAGGQEVAGGGGGIFDLSPQTWLSSDAANPLIAGAEQSRGQAAKGQLKSATVAPPSHRLVKSALFRLINADDPKSEAEVKEGDQIALEILLKQPDGSQKRQGSRYGIAARILLEQQQDPRYSKARLDRVTSGASRSGLFSSLPSSSSSLLAAAASGLPPPCSSSQRSQAVAAVPVADDGIARPSEALSKWKGTAAPLLSSFHGFPGEKDPTALAATTTSSAVTNATAVAAVPQSLRMYLPSAASTVSSARSSRTALASSSSSVSLAIDGASKLMTSFRVRCHTAAEVSEALRWGIDSTTAAATSSTVAARGEGAGGGSGASGTARVHFSSKEKGSEVEVEVGGRPHTPTATTTVTNFDRRPQLRPRSGSMSSSANSPHPRPRPRSSASASARSGGSEGGGGAGSNHVAAGLLLSSNDALQLSSALQKMLSKPSQRLATLKAGTNFMPREALADPLSYRFNSAVNAKKKLSSSSSSAGGGGSGSSGARISSAARRSSSLVSVPSMAHVHDSDRSGDSDTEAESSKLNSAGRRRQRTPLANSKQPGVTTTGAGAGSVVELGHLAVVSLSLDLGHLQAVRVVVPPDVVTSASAAATAAIAAARKNDDDTSTLHSPSAGTGSSLPTLSPSASATPSKTPSKTPLRDDGPASARSSFSEATTTIATAFKRPLTSTTRGSRGGSSGKLLRNGSSRRSLLSSSATRRKSAAEGHEEAIPMTTMAEPSQAPLFEVVVAPDLETSSSSQPLAFPSDTAMFGLAVVPSRTLVWSGAEAYEKRHGRRFLELDMNSKGSSGGADGGGDESGGSSSGATKADGAVLPHPHHEPLDGGDDDDEEDDDEDDVQDAAMEKGTYRYDEEDEEARRRLRLFKKEKKRRERQALAMKAQRQKESQWEDFLRGHRDLKGRPRSAPPTNLLQSQSQSEMALAVPFGDADPPSSRSHSRSRHAHSASATSASSFIDSLGIPSDVIRSTGRRGGRFHANDGGEGAEEERGKQIHPLFQTPTVRAAGMWRLWLVSPSLSVLNAQQNSNPLLSTSGPAAMRDDEGKPLEADGAAGAGTALVSSRSHMSTTRTTAMGLEVSRIVSDRARRLSAAAALGRPASALGSGRRSQSRGAHDEEEEGQRKERGGKGSKWTLERLKKEEGKRTRKGRQPMMRASGSTPALWPSKQPLPLLGQHGIAVSASSSSLPLKAVPPLPTALLAIIAAASSSTGALKQAGRPKSADKASTPFASPSAGASAAAAASTASFAVVQDKARRQLLLQASPQNEDLYASIKALATPKATKTKTVRHTNPLLALRSSSGNGGTIARESTAAGGVAGDDDAAAQASLYYTDTSVKLTPMAASLARKSLLSPIHRMVAERKTPKAGAKPRAPEGEEGKGEEGGSSSMVRFEEKGKTPSPSKPRPSGAVMVSALLAETLSCFAPVPSPSLAPSLTVAAPGTDPRLLAASTARKQRAEELGLEEEDVVLLGELAFAGRKVKAFPYKSGPLTPRRVRLSPIEKQAAVVVDEEPQAEAEETVTSPAPSSPPPLPAFSDELKLLAKLILASDRLKARILRDQEREERRRERMEEKGRILAKLVGTPGVVAAASAVASSGAGGTSGRHRIFSFLISEEEPEYHDQDDDSSNSRGSVGKGNEQDEEEARVASQGAFLVVASRVLTAAAPSSPVQLEPTAADHPLPPPDKLPYCERKAKRTLQGFRTLVAAWRRRKELLRTMSWTLLLAGHKKILATIVKKKAAITGGFDDDDDDDNGDDSGDKHQKKNGDAGLSSRNRRHHQPLTAGPSSGGAKGLIGVLASSAKVSRKAAEQLIVQADAGKAQFVKLVNSTRGAGPSTSKGAAVVTTTLVNWGPGLTVEVLGAPPLGNGNRAETTRRRVVGIDDVVAMVLPKTRGAVTPRIKPYPRSIAPVVMKNNNSSSGGAGNKATTTHPLSSFASTAVSPKLKAAGSAAASCATEDDPRKLRRRRELTADIEDGLQRSASDASLRPRRPFSGLHLAVKVDELQTPQTTKTKTQAQTPTPFSSAARSLQRTFGSGSSSVSVARSASAKAITAAAAAVATPDPRPHGEGTNLQLQPSLLYQQKAQAASMPSLPLIEESTVLAAYNPGLFSVAPAGASPASPGSCQDQHHGGRSRRGRSLLDFIFEAESEKRAMMLAANR